MVDKICAIINDINNNRNRHIFLGGLQMTAVKTRGFLYVFAILLLAAYFMYIIVSTPYIGLNVKEAASGELEITAVDDFSWAQYMGIQAGNNIQSVNDQSPELFPALRHHMKLEGAND